MRSPGGGCAEPGGNVLIGNFALFGASGGRLFVEGEAGDRFAVRNSGATAVVEGVGDFLCEYMTNGAVFNLGGFGKGVANGMCGGFLYQYDPAGELPRRSAPTRSCSALDHRRRPPAAFHEAAALPLLDWHVEATGSVKARPAGGLGRPRTRTSSYGDAARTAAVPGRRRILAAKSRKELLDELRRAGGHSGSQFKRSYRAGAPVPAAGPRFRRPTPRRCTRC